MLLFVAFVTGCGAASGERAAPVPDPLPTPGLQLGDMPPAERIPPYLPAVPPLPAPIAPPIPAAPAPAPSYAPGLPPGPVTNYGTGGMQALPGAPPNPPYPPGGLMH